MMIFAGGVLAVLGLIVVFAVASARAPRGSWSRRISVVGALALTGLVGFSWWAVSYPRMQPLEVDQTLAIGVRVDDGAAQVWLGPGCEDVTELEVVLKVQGSPRSEVLELTAGEPGVAVDRFGLTPDTYPAGMEAVEPLVAEALDLGQHRSLTVGERRVAGVLLAPAIDGSAQRPGEFWFDESGGWSSVQEATARFDAGELSTVCDPAPEGTFAG